MSRIFISYKRVDKDRVFRMKERKVALELAYPNYRPREEAQIRIKPYNIQPHTTPPKDMIEHFHFEEL